MKIIAATVYEWERDKQRQGGNETVNGEGARTGGGKQQEEKKKAKQNENPAAAERTLRGSCRQTKRYSLPRDGSQIVCAWQKETRDKSVTEMNVCKND